MKTSLRISLNTRCSLSSFVEITGIRHERRKKTWRPLVITIGCRRCKYIYIYIHAHAHIAYISGDGVNSKRLLLLFRDQWKSGLDCFPSKCVYYWCIMHERVARSSLHRVFFLFSRDTKEHSTRLSTRKLREIAAGWMDVYTIFFFF